MKSILIAIEDPAHGLRLMCDEMDGKWPGMPKPHSEIKGDIKFTRSHLKVLKDLTEI